MSSLHLVDPELAASLSQLPSFAMTDETLPLIRSAPIGVIAEDHDDDNVRRTERYVPGPTGAPKVRVLVYTPTAAAAPMPAVLHMHGGGYVIGKPEMNGVRNRALARQLGCVVASVDYRLAPEHPFPASVEDCYAVLQWLQREAATLGVDNKRIAVSGESAGGGLAASLALLARDRGDITLCFQQLIFPMMDDRTGSNGDPHPYTGEFIWNAASNQYGWRSLLGKPAGGDDVSPYAAAARASNVAGLAPAFIAVGALDLFVEDNMEYARRLMRAGVPTELHVYPGAFHGYHLVATAYVTRQAERDAEQALRRAFHVSE